MKWFTKRKLEEPLRPWRVYYQDTQNQYLFQHYFSKTPAVGDYVRRWPDMRDYEISSVDEANHVICVRGFVS